MLYILTTKETIFKRNYKVRNKRKLHLIKHGYDRGNNSHVGIEDVVAQRT